LLKHSELKSALSKKADAEPSLPKGLTVFRAGAFAKAAL
jgi:hypothetical protein